MDTRAQEQPWYLLTRCPHDGRVTAQALARVLKCVCVQIKPKSGERSLKFSPDQHGDKYNAHTLRYTHICPQRSVQPVSC